MAKEQSNKNKYPSRYSPKKWVREDQYIIELICEKKAKQDKKDLPINFWKDPGWASFFKSQLRRCKSLLQKYSAAAIIKALQDPKSWNIYSLFAPWLEPLIESYHKQERAITELKDEDHAAIIDASFKRPEFNKKKNILDLLE